MTPAKLDLIAFRNVVFLDTFIFQGIDFFGAELLMQIRLYPDAPGAALIELEDVADIDIENGIEVSVDSGGPVPVTTMQFRIHQNDLQALPAAAEAAEDVVLAYDLITTGVGANMSMLTYGKFTVRGSVTKLP